MLSRQYRLQKDKDFELVFKEGKIFSSKFLFLKLRKNNLKDSRFGFILSKKISKKSTVRNKIKRKLREIIRKDLDKIRAGFDVVIVVKPEIISKNYRDMSIEIEKLLGKAGLYK